MAHGKLRYRPLPLIASPLEQHGHAHGHKAHKHGSEQPSIEKGEEVITVQEQYDATPAFREREEASSIELFYDLFFVANLTTFTANKPIDDKNTISSYIGFFVLLWFTWLQVVVYDVRFGIDSLFERFCKLLHFGVMVSFAIVGNSFDPSSPKTSYVSMRQLSLIMMVSRIVLICQYTSVVYWVRQHRKITTPLVIHVLALAIGAVLCLGFFFTFTSKSSGKAYIGWYVVAILEALAVFLSSSQWKVVGFKHTNLHERCGLLTLIILGEGIIVLTKAMSYVTKGENFSAPIIGQIISATLIIYFLYMLYFDRVPNPHIHLPSWSHNFWALIHFPFHLALVLFMEGTSRLITWRNALEMFDVIYEGWNDIWLASNDTAILADGFTQLGDIVLEFSEADLSKFNITGYLTDLTNEADGATEGAAVAAVEILVTLVNALFKFFKIEASKKEVKKEAAEGLKVDPLTSLQNAIAVYDLVFVYFFVAAGLTLVIMALLMVVSKRKKVLGDWLGVALRLALGVGISLVAIVKTNFDAKDSFLSSAWMLPCVMLGLLVVVVAEGVLGWVLPAPRKEGGHGEVEREG